MGSARCWQELKYRCAQKGLSPGALSVGSWLPNRSCSYRPFASARWALLGTTGHGHVWAEQEELSVCKEQKCTDQKPVFFHTSILEQKWFWTKNTNITPRLGPGCANGLCLHDEYFRSSFRTWASAPRSWKPVPCLTRIHLMKLKSNKISCITQDYYFLPHCVFIL